MDIEVLYTLVDSEASTVMETVYNQFNRKLVAHRFIEAILRERPEWVQTMSDLSEAFQECRDAIVDFIGEKFWFLKQDCSPYANLLIEKAVRRLGPRAVTIYTTNYDTSIEDYLTGKVAHNRGLMGDFFYPEYLVTSEAEEVKLIKLHGSIDFYRLRSSEVVRINTFRRPGPWRGGDIIEGVYIVPPEEGKIQYDEMQNLLLEHFEVTVQSAEAMAIIGTSMRDERLSRILSRIPEDSPVLIACGSKSEGHKNALFDHHGNVTCIPEHFPHAKISDWLDSTMAQFSQNE